MPEPSKRSFFGGFLLSAILIIGAIAPVLLNFAKAQLTQTGNNIVWVAAPSTTQLHYRWRNDDGGEQAAALNWATTSPAWSSVLYGLAVDGQYVYAVGEATGSVSWSIEKRDISNGALIFATTSRAGDADAIAIDGQYMYVAGDDNSGPWYLEKRNLSNGALVYTVSSSAGTDGSSYPRSVQIDGSAMYITGRGGSSAVRTWRLEKRNLSDGSFMSTFASSGVLIIATGTPTYPPTSVVDGNGTYLYSVEDNDLVKISQSNGSIVYSTSAIDVLAADTIALSTDKNMVFMGGVSNGCNCNWALEGRSASSGASVWSLQDNFSATSTGDIQDWPVALAADNTYLYAAGGEDSPDANWLNFKRIRFEKRLRTDGSLVYATTSDPTIGADAASGISLNGQNAFLIGSQATATLARIESRTLGHDTSTATFATTEDNPLLNLGIGTLARLRLMVQNNGDAAATSSNYRLEYATSSGGPWFRVGTPASTGVDWIMGSSVYVTNTQGTHDISPGLTDPTSTPAAWWSGQFMATSSQAILTSTLSAGQFTEYEYALKPTGSSTASIPYYFRLTNQGTTLNSYAIYATATVSTVVPLTVSAVTVNGGSPIILNPNATTAVSVSWTVSGGQGCGNIFYGSGVVTSTLYRSGVSSTCATGNPTQSTLNCYYTATTTNNCTSATSTASANATTTFYVWYFADSTTDTSTASSSYPNQSWQAYVSVKTGSSTLASSTSPSGVSLYPMLAIALNSSTLNYGTIAPSSTTGSTNQSSNIKNAGNATTTLKVNGTALVSGGNTITTSSQHYATGTFTYGGSEQQLQVAASAVSGFLIKNSPIGSWSTASIYPSTIGGDPLPTTAYNNYAYVVGGYINYGGVVTSTVRFAPLNASGTIGTWATTTAYPAKITDASLVAWNNYLYVVGGTDGANDTSTVRYAHINATGSLSSWSTTTAFPDGTFSQQNAVVYNGYIYAISDCNIGCAVWFAQIGSTGTLGAWVQGTTLPNAVPTNGKGVAAYNNYLYTVAGNDGATNTAQVNYAPIIGTTGTVGTWATTTPYSIAVSPPGVGVDNGLLYGFAGDLGGSNGTTTSAFAPINGNGTLGKWSALPAFPTPIGTVSAFTNNGYIYSVGGFDYLGSSDYTSTIFYAPLASRNLYWGLSVPNGQPAGNYSSTITYTAVFSP